MAYKRYYIERKTLKRILRSMEGYSDTADTIIDKCKDFTFSSTDIVKPCLDVLKIMMEERDKKYGGESSDMVNKGYHLACEHLYKEIDEILKYCV